MCSRNHYIAAEVHVTAEKKMGHELDQLRTDYVIIRHGYQEQLVAQFLQYSNFVAQWEY